MTEPEKAFLINVGAAIAVPPFIPIALIAWPIFRSKTPQMSREFRRALGTEIVVGASLYALFALLMLFSSFAARMPQIAPGTPKQVFELPDAGASFTSGVVVAGSKPTEFRIAFSEKDVVHDASDGTDSDNPVLRSLGGDWAGRNARLSVDGFTVADGKPTSVESDWPSSISDKGVLKALPEMTVSYTPDEADAHTELDVEASMDVDMPYKSDSTHYGLTGARVAKRAKLYVITAKEADQRIDWNVATNRGPIRGVGSGLLVVASLVGYSGWRQRRAYAPF